MGHQRPISVFARRPLIPRYRPDRCTALSDALGRLCCKSRKLQICEFLAKTRNGKQSPIRITSIRVTEVAGEFNVGRRGPPHLYTKAAPVALRIFDHPRKTTFATKAAPVALRIFDHPRKTTFATVSAKNCLTRRWLARPLSPHKAEGQKWARAVQQFSRSSETLA
jgi:hypothetical protein